MKKYFKIIFKVLKVSVITLLLIFLLAFILIQTPKVQNWLVHTITNSLSAKLNTEVSIKGVSLDFFKTAVIEGVFIEDQQADTLLYVEKLKVDIGLFSLLKRKIFLNKVSLQGAVANLTKAEKDSVFNFQFIIDGLGSNAANAPKKKEQAAPWEFGLGNILIENTRFNMADKNEAGFSLETSVGELAINPKELDFENKKIEVSDFNLFESSVAFTLLKGEKKAKPDTANLSFPAIGWEISAGGLNLQKTQFAFTNQNLERQSDILDYNHLGFNDISLIISNIKLTDTLMLANIQKASLSDHSGLSLEHLKGALLMDNQNISAKNLDFKTSNSILKGDVALTFDDFENLADFMNKVKLDANFQKSNVAYRDLVMLVPVLKDIPVVETNINENIDLNGEIILQKNSIRFNKFYSKIGKIFTLDATGSIDRLTNDPLFDLNIKKLITNRGNFIKLTKDIPLPEGLAQLGEINFSGQLKGTIDQLRGQQWNLVTSSGTSYKGNLNITGLPKIETTIFKANVDHLRTNPNDIAAIAGTAFPGVLDSLQFVNFSGDFDGTIYEFDVAGDFMTGAGEAKTDLSINFEKDYQFAHYEGDLEFCDFDLSAMLGEAFGQTSLSLNVEGSGLNIKDLDIKSTGEILSFEYQSYEYQNLFFNGNFLKKRFEGIAKSGDENLNFDFQGMIDLNDSLPDMAMVLNAEQINLKPLNLFEQDLSFRGNLEANLVGNRLDNMNGSANLEKFYVSLDSVTYSTEQPISLVADVPFPNKKALRFRSEFLDFDIDGNFNLKDFPLSVIEFVNGLFPIEDLVTEDSVAIKKIQAPEQDVNYNFQIKNISPIAKVFVPEFNHVDTSVIVGDFNSKAKKLNFEGLIPNLSYGDLEIDSINLISKGTPEDLKSEFTFKEIAFGENMDLPLMTLNTFFANQELNFGINILGRPEITKNFLTETRDTAATDQKLDLKGKFSRSNQYYKLSFLQDFILNNENWSFGEKNKIEFNNNDLKISDLVIKNQKQKIAINSRGPRPENDIQPIEIEIFNFDLEEISEMLGMNQHKLGGMVNGDLLLKEPKNNLHYISEIIIDNLAYNDKLVGDLDIKAQRETIEEIIDLDIRLTGENQMSIIGNYAVESRYFDLDFRLGRIPMFLADPLMRGILKESNGYLWGDIKVKGSPDQPGVNGTLNLSDFSTTAVISNMQYRTEKSSIKISEKLIDLGEITLKDANNNDATLGGKIFHNYFQDIVFDLDFKTSAFQFLNTTAVENELYFGDLFLEASVQINGTPSLPILIIDAATLPNSRLFVQPFSGEQAISQENYIIFSNPDLYSPDSIQLIEQRIVSSRTPFELSLNLQVTNDAILYIIIDPLTGDQLISVGAANLSVNINPSGVLTVVGNYTIESGSYSLNYQQLVKRDFEIEKGSHIIFSGDPLNASFDVTAKYEVRASTYELLANQSVASEAELKAASVRTDVVVLMKLKGNLSEPDISFDILLPNAQIDGVSSAANRKLAELRRNPEELNKQAFGLLLFKSFISESNGSQSFSDAGTAMALSSVSNLLSDQLTSFADKYIEGFEVDIGVESYNTSGTQSQNVTKMQMNVSKKLFQDRLTINVGTNVNIGAQDASSIFNSDFSAIAGDFVLEYQLNEKGNYHIKVFHKSDYNVLEQNNDYKTGAGIIFRKSFNGKNYK